MNIKPDYGIDAPGIILALAIFGIILPCGQLYIFYYLASSYANPLFIPFGYFAAGCTLVSLWVTALLMLLTSKYGKLIQSRRVLNMISWTGTEVVLDAGCGRGLFAIQVAKYYSTVGKIVGVDIWNQRDLSNNSAQAAYENAVIQGVADRIEFHDGNICDLSYDDAIFDVVVSSMVIHNIAFYEDRMQALTELMRVIKPGGYLLVQDIFYTQEYYDFFANSEYITHVELSGFQWGMFPLSRVLIVKKI